MEPITYLWKDRKRILGLPITFTRYRLSEDRIFRETGLLNLKEEEVLLYRVRDLELKRSLFQRIFFEFIDKYFIEGLAKDITNDDIVIITCDHATPCELKIHCTDKVPVLIAGNQCIKDGSIKFDEENAERGNLPIQKAIDIFPYIIKNLNKEN